MSNLNIQAASSNSYSNEPPSSPTMANGHQDPTQRRIYLTLLGILVATAATGLALLLTWVLKYRPVTGLGLDSAQKLTNLHPIMMFTFMVSINMYAVLVYRTHYSSPKKRLKWAHASLAGINIVMSLLGVLTVLKAHNLTGTPNFYSLHSWIGVLTNAFYVAQFAGGFVAFLSPGLSQTYKIALMPWHRRAGVFLLLLAALAAITGIGEMVIFQDKNSQYSSFAPITFVANFSGIIIIIMTALSIYLVTEPKYIRPAKPEEEPLKRR